MKTIRSAVSRREALRGAVLIGFGGLAGCIGGTSAPAPRKFYLSVPSEPPPGLTPVDWSLVVEPPQTIPALNTNRIAQAFGSNEFDYYAEGEWGDRAPAMVQAIVIRAFERSGAIGVVANERQRLRPDFMLNTSLAPFFARGALGEPPAALVGLDAQLVQARGREIVGTRSFEASTQAESADLAAIVAAFDDATHQVLRELIPWTLTTGNTAWSGPTG